MQLQSKTPQDMQQQQQNALGSFANAFGGTSLGGVCGALFPDSDLGLGWSLDLSRGLDSLRPQGSGNREEREGQSV